MATDVNFINVFTAQELGVLESDGLLGLGPRPEPYNRARGSSGQDVHLLVDELKKDGVIDRAMFAMYLADDRAKSFAHFGGYDQKIVEESVRELEAAGVDTSDSENGIYWMEINSDSHWQARLQDANIGSKSLQQSVSNVMFDTGSSLCYMP